MDPALWTVAGLSGLVGCRGRGRGRSVLVFGRGEISEGGVSSVAVVEALDVLEDLGAELSACRPGLAVHELLLEGREEALGDGVVVGIAREPIDTAIPKARLTYCEPRSL